MAKLIAELNPGHGSVLWVSACGQGPPKNIQRSNSTFKNTAQPSSKAAHGKPRGRRHVEKKKVSGKTSPKATTYSVIDAMRRKSSSSRCRVTFWIEVLTTCRNHPVFALGAHRASRTAGNTATLCGWGTRAASSAVHRQSSSMLGWLSPFELPPSGTSPLHASLLSEPIPSSLRLNYNTFERTT